MSRLGYIYSIVSKTEGTVYIGSTIQKYPNNRKLNHFWQLNTNTHDNWKLQRIVNKYGLDDLIFTIELRKDFSKYKELIAIEKEWIRTIPEDYSLNINRSPDENPMQDRKHKQSTKDLISLANKGRTASEVTKGIYREQRKGDKNSNAKLTWDQVNEIRFKHWEHSRSNTSLASEYSVSAGMIDRIINNTSWWNQEYENKYKNINYNLEYSQEYRDQCRQRALSYFRDNPVSEETKIKISRSNIGKHSGYKNPAFGLKGKDNPNWGLPKHKKGHEAYLHFPDGKHYFVLNNYRFCKEFSLDKAYISGLSTGRVKHYKGIIGERAPKWLVEKVLPLMRRGQYWVEVTENGDIIE